MNLKCLTNIITIIMMMYGVHGEDALYNLSKKYDYKFSLKSPYHFPPITTTTTSSATTNEDNNNNNNPIIPYFETFGNVISSGEHFIRLTPSIPHQRGSIWSKNPIPYPEWQIKLSLKISGKTMIGGRGLAFWYTKLKMNQECTNYRDCTSMMGSRENFNGVGVILDTTTANPSTGSNRVIPQIYAIQNYHNSNNYHHEEGEKAVKAGVNHWPSLSKNTCFFNYHNTHHPFNMRITNVNKSLIVDYDLSIGSSGHPGHYTHCTTMNYHNEDDGNGGELPVGYYFGVSAMTGDVYADDMDLISFETWQVNPKPLGDLPIRPHELEKIASHESINFTESETYIHEAEQLAHDYENYDDDIVEEDVEIFTIQYLEQLKETQFKILKSLESLHTATTNNNNNFNNNIHNNTSSGAGGHQGQMILSDHNFQQLQNMIMNQLTTRMDTLSNTVNNKIDVLFQKQALLEQKIQLVIQTLSSTRQDTKLESLENRINQIFSKLEKEFLEKEIISSSSSSNLAKGHSTHMMILISLSSIGVLLGFYTTWINRKTYLKEKKFI